MAWYSTQGLTIPGSPGQLIKCTDSSGPSGLQGCGEWQVQRPGGGHALGGFQVWWMLALLRMGEQRAARSRGEQGGPRGQRPQYDSGFAAAPAVAVRRSPLGAGQRPAGDEALVVETGQRQACVAAVTCCDSWPALFPSADPSSTRPPAQPLVSTNLEGVRQGS